MARNRFEGQVAIVTGGGTGIGKAIAKQLADEGAKVVIWGRRLNKLTEAAQEIGADKCEAMSVDISDEEAVKTAIAEIHAKYGRIDALANIGAIPGPSALAEEYTVEDFKAVLDINVTGTFITTKYCLPIMKAQGKGAIVNTSSCSGIRAYEYEIGYGTSKAAIIGLTMCTARENGRTGVRCNCYSPGFVATDMTASVLSQYEEIGAGQDANALNCGTMDRVSTPEEMSEVVCFLLSDDASYVNGANFVCDGGKTIQ